jgi:hypothetical protein
MRFRSEGENLTRWSPMLTMEAASCRQRLSARRRIHEYSTPCSQKCIYHLCRCPRAWCGAQSYCENGHGVAREIGALSFWPGCKCTSRANGAAQLFFADFLFASHFAFMIRRSLALVASLILWPPLSLADTVVLGRSWEVAPLILSNRAIVEVNWSRSCFSLSISSCAVIGISSRL